MTKKIMIGVDLAKNIFQLHAASMTGQVLFRKKLSRQGIVARMPVDTVMVAKLSRCTDLPHAQQAQ